jgi:hypothetical protein
VPHFAGWAQSGWGCRRYIEDMMSRHVKTHIYKKNKKTRVYLKQLGTRNILKKYEARKVHVL